MRSVTSLTPSNVLPVGKGSVSSSTTSRLPGMTQPEDPGRETRVVSIKGRPIIIRKPTDAQMLHLMRHTRILQSDNVAIPQKLDSVERMALILDKMIVQQEDRDFLTGLEEEGDLELKDRLQFIGAFEEQEPEKPKVRRGRPPARR